MKTKYKDNVSGLYFFDKNVSSYIKMLSKPVTEQFLILRGVIPIDKVVWIFFIIFSLFMTDFVSKLKDELAIWYFYEAYLKLNIKFFI